MYTYSWGAITPTETVYMQPAIAVVPKSSETIAVELKEDVVVGNTDGEI